MKESFEAVSVTLEIDGVRALFVLLARDGAINRLGTGAVDNSERDLFIGQSQEGLFERYLARVPEEIFQHAGRYELRERAGADCELQILFHGAAGSTGFEFHYGAESEGPPREIVELVVAAVELTEPWYSEQMEMARRAQQA